MSVDRLSTAFGDWVAVAVETGQAGLPRWCVDCWTFDLIVRTGSRSPRCPQHRLQHRRWYVARHKQATRGVPPEDLPSYVPASPRPDPAAPAAVAPRVRQGLRELEQRLQEEVLDNKAVAAALQRANSVVLSQALEVVREVASGIGRQARRLPAPPLKPPKLPARR